MERADSGKFGLVTLSWSFLLGWVASMSLVALYTGRSGRKTRQPMAKKTGAMGDGVAGGVGESVEVVDRDAWREGKGCGIRK